MPDSVAPEAAPAEAPHAEIRSGWKTTEAWLAMLLLGGLAAAGQQLITALPTILANPAIPPWVAPIGPIAVVGLGWVMKLVVSEYTKSRVALKLGVDPDVAAAVAAGAAAAKADPASTLAAINK